MLKPIITILKSINAMPFPFTMRHYQIFGSTSSKMKYGELNFSESWDVLREEHPFFSISQNREEWLAASELQVKKDGQDADLRQRAIDIAKLITANRFERIFSVGVGGAALEYQLKKLLPKVPIVASDYSQVTVNTLRKVFVECDDIVQFDLLHGDWGVVQKKYLGDRGLCLMYRVDASFSDDEWKAVFKNMAAAGIANILVIPTGTLTMLSVYNRKLREVKWLLKRIPIIFSGYVRTKWRFYDQWKSLYRATELQLGGLRSFLLELK